MTKQELMDAIAVLDAELRAKRKKLKELTAQLDPILVKEGVLKKIKRLNEAEKAALAQMLAPEGMPSESKVGTPK